MIMTSETIKLNLIPGGELPVLHASQFDDGRALSFEIYDGDEPYASYAAYNISLHLRKVDGTIIGIDTFTIDEVNDCVVFTTTEQMCACAGKNIGELVFTDSLSGVVVGSCNFILEVEPDPYAGGIDSASDIENLSTQIAAIVDGQLDNYYTKEEIDDQIETIVTQQVTPIVSGIVSEQVPPIVESELTNYYTKSETDSAFYNKSAVDTLLSGKADTSALPDMSDYYDKTTTDTLLASKANTSTTYTKTEVDNLIAAIPSNDITSEIDIPASIQTFNDGGNDIPMKSCEISIPIDAQGFSSVKIFTSGKNILDSSIGTRNYTSPYTFFRFGGTSADPVDGSLYLAKGTYTFSISTTAYVLRALDKDNQSIEFVNNDNKLTFTLTESQKCMITIAVSGNVQLSDFTYQLELNDQATSYEAYKGHTYTISFGETLTQGGILEAVSGLLTRTDTTTKQLTGVNLPTKTGINNVFADTGNIEQIEYFNNKADDIAAMISLMTRS